MKTKRVSNQTVRETVETVPPMVGVGSTSLKRGVNRRFSRMHPSLVTRHSTLVTRLGFTLIELLVVIGIMAILAALIIPITSAVSRQKLRNRTKAELRSIETAIEDYKTKRGYYPPDNPGNKYWFNQLYYELSGTTVNGTTYTTLDGNATLDTSMIAVPIYGQGFKGFVNTTKGAGDEGMAAQKFIRELKPTQIAETQAGVKILVASVGWDSPSPLVPMPPAMSSKINPFRYVSTNPTNNPKSFDLWVDIIISGKTNRISNWSDD